ncbi:hypothetical protein D7X33_10310 [Butyricicoccus sp. 1XD8-22]|nr:hypothetical protein D7X33_10310 [Butyricicoccus sp. 1XD8-22]
MCDRQPAVADRPIRFQITCVVDRFGFQHDCERVQNARAANAPCGFAVYRFIGCRTVFQLYRPDGSRRGRHPAAEPRALEGRPRGG